jgi:hypothetical protein
MTARGSIRNRDFAQQLRDFTGLCFGKISPTDIDAFMDFGGEVFIFIEAKHGNAPLRHGQRLALERLCDACQKAGVESIVLVASHDTDGDVSYATLPVTLIRLHGKWRPPTKPMTVRQAIDEFRFWCDKKKSSP